MSVQSAEDIANVQEEFPDTQENPRSESGLPKLWDVRDPFQYAPPKPDGDPWTMLVEPLLKKDKMRCDAWKDEVQNLLIFGGLFSAIVTAFIIESYKNLQQDPNDTVIALLSQIASRLDSPLNASTAATLAHPTAFSPDASAVRVNIFWFISLVLSLATVLIGIISLQWLREHQVYPDLSPREIYAMYNMRADGLVKWHVDKIFTAMPLLLQCGLVLFLGGIIDFLHAIGIWTVTIPVIVVVALTLLFLIATTLLPCLQVLSLYIHISPKPGRPQRPQHPPSQCPYKSPQSHAARTALGLIQKIWYRLQMRIRSLLHILWHYAQQSFSSNPGPQMAPYNSDNFEAYLFQLCQVSRWSDFDEVWLAIRDAYTRRAFNRSLEWNEVLGFRLNQMLPIYDIINGLLSQSWRKSSAIPAYHCFTEICEVAEHDSLKYSDYYTRRRRIGYLHDLLSNDQTLSDDVCLSHFLDLRVSSDAPEGGIPLPSSILHQQNTFLFLHRYYLQNELPSLMWSHKLELALRLARYFYQERLGAHSSDFQHQSIPRCLTLRATEIFIDVSDWLFVGDNYYIFSWQIGNLTLSLLRHLEAEDYTTDDVPPNIVVQQNNLASLMEIASRLALGSVQWKSSGAQTTRITSPLQSANASVFASIAALFVERLSAEILLMPTGNEGPPSVWFYLAAFYWDSIFNGVMLKPPSFESLQSALLRYKLRTIDKGMTDSIMEGRLQRYYEHEFTPVNNAVFSKEWWDDLHDRLTSSSTNGPGWTTPSTIFYPFCDTN